MKGYDSYKKTNYDWFEKIPSNWEIASLNHLVTFIMGQAPHSDSYNTEGIGEIFIKTGDFGAMRPVAKWFTTTPLVFASEDDVFMCVVGATSGKVNLGVNGTISRSIAALRPNKNISQKFLYYYLSYNYQILNDSAQGSAQGIINKTILSNVKMPFPSIQVQATIASFLDYKTNLIDATIEKKKRLIDLLKEKRQAVINEAVTKGLNPNAPTKDSGVEWLGEIPEHWEVKKLKLHLDFMNNLRVPIDSSERFERQGQFPYYGASGIIDYVDDYIFDGKYILIGEDGANILSRTTPLAFIAEGKFWVNNHAHILSVPKGILEYFCYQMELIDYAPLASGSAQPKLTKEAIGNLKLFIPPVEEQKNIFNYINEITNKIDSISSNIENSIKKLQDYRQSLISEAVTGKIDVRDWQA